MNRNSYIKVGDAIDAFARFNTPWTTSKSALKEAETLAESALKGVKTYDIERHGHWIRETKELAREIFDVYTKCSLCGYKLCGAEPDYCPGCGARMDDNNEQETN